MAAEKNNKPLNVLFIAVDDLKPALGCYGDPHAVSPNLDRFAERSVQFNRAYCQVAVCNPSRASLMTGLRPDTLGVWTLPIHFREAMPDAITMPQWFRRFGYTAVSHGKIYHNPTPDPQSWSEPIPQLPRLAYPYPKGTPKRVREVMASLPAGDWRKGSLRGPSTAAPEVEDSQLLDGALTDMTIKDLRRLGQREEPFFIAMGYIRPHLAWIAPKKYWDMYDPASLPMPEMEQIIPNTPRIAMHNNSEFSHYVDLIDMPAPWSRRKLPDEKIRHMVHAYYACVSYIDAQIGRLLSTLDEEGLAENTVVVLWSDHGYKLGEYRGWGKMTNYEIDTRVPLFISTPGMKNAGKQTNQFAELMDLYPTLCELAGIETPSFVEGVSLAPVLDDVDAPARASAVSQYYRRYKDRDYMGYALRTDQHRFVEWRDFQSGEVTDRELYDHRQPGLESENIVDSASEALIADLTEKLLQTHPRKGLKMTPEIHSNLDQPRTPTELTLRNNTSTVLVVNRITAAGSRERANVQIKPGAARRLSAAVGEVFVVESTDGTIHQVYTAAATAQTIDVSAESANAAA